MILGLYNKDYITSREKAEKDLRNSLNLLKNPGSSSKPNSSSMGISQSSASTGSGAVPGLTIPRQSPQGDQRGAEVASQSHSSIPPVSSSQMRQGMSAPGQERASLAQTSRNQYQPAISTVDMHVSSFE